VEWYRTGLGIPETLRDVACRYRYDADPVHLFVETRTEGHPGGRISATALFSEFKRWSKENGYGGRVAMNSNAFGRRLTRLKVERKRLRDGFFYMNIRFRVDTGAG
jgi:phage/plasmid-associated DNA primase